MIKNFLKQWLGINDLQRSQHPLVYRDNLRVQISKVLEEVLTVHDSNPPGVIFVGLDYRDTIRKSFERVAAVQVRQAIETEIGTEAFIDSVIERIKKKQL